MRGRGRKILGGKHFIFLEPETGRIWWLKKVQISTEKVPLPMDLPAWKNKWIYHNLGNLLRPLESIRASRE